jgi:hypothetical protein
MPELLSKAAKGLETGLINTPHAGTGQGQTGGVKFAPWGVDSPESRRYIAHQCPDGGIGRRTGFRYQRRKAWRFESSSGHHLTIRSLQELQSLEGKGGFLGLNTLFSVHHKWLRKDQPEDGLLDAKVSLFPYIIGTCEESH